MKRKTNYEFLRIVAMLMIIALHYLDKGGILPKLNTGFNGVGYLAWFLEAFCLMSVNVYVLLSGYFGVESRWRIQKAATLWGQVFFYSIGIALAAALTGILPAKELSVYQWFGYLFPIVTEHYWFATSYLFLFFLMPFLHAGVKKLEKKQLRGILAGLLLFTCIAKTAIPMQLPTDHQGYEVLWFIIVYLVGAYLREYGRQPSLTESVLTFCLSGTALSGITMALRFVWMKTGSLENFMGYAYSYNYLFCLTGAVGLFRMFGHIHVQREKWAKWICTLSGCTFGVYLIHEHMALRYLWPTWFHTEKVVGSIWFLPHMLLTVLVVFALCGAIEYLRKRIFAFAAFKYNEKRNKTL